VVGSPRPWLQVEGVALLIGAFVAYPNTKESWWLVAIFLFAPDLFATGYLLGNRVGAFFYNVSHATILPMTLAGFGLLRHDSLAVAIGLVWLAHVGLDRALGYGLKYNDNFQHTHLGWIGRSKNR
jgi:hypothetical protein